MRGPDVGGGTITYHYLIQRKAPGEGFAFVSEPLGQRLAGLKPLDATWRARIGTHWSKTNGSPHSQAYVLTGGKQVAKLTTLKELSGYVLISNPDGGGALMHQLVAPLSDARAGITVKVPGLTGRDLFELIFSTVDEAPRMTIGRSIYKQTAW
jgi:hypothetical protein